MDVPLKVCETRDPKGLYKLARAGKIKGVSCSSSEDWDLKTLLFLLFLCIFIHHPEVIDGYTYWW